uniref:C3/C5 convertase n=1 Tax=Nematostella vectensis TaxID=45351 RepID=B9X083_NEMVE|nr:complement factor B precursor [Nematostella vectensis]
MVLCSALALISTALVSAKPPMTDKSITSPTALRCPVPQSFPHGKVKVLYGGRALYYSCPQGKLIGTSHRFCDVQTGQWSGRQPICKVPSVPKCLQPTIPNGHVSFRRGRRNRFVAKYTCKRGYKLIGEERRTCKNGRWRPPAVPSCKKERCSKECKRLTTPAHALMGGSSRNVGSLVRFVCVSGYVLIGQEFLKCGCNGQWDSRVPKCVKKDPLADLRRAADGLRMHFINKLELLTTDSRVRSGLSSGAAGLDLVFVFDSSASVGEDNFRKGIQFARTIIDEFGISATPSGTRVAVIVFSDAAQVIFNLKSNRIVDKEEAVRRLENLQFQGGGTATKLALQAVIDTVTPELRNNSKKALFLITDGKSNKGGSPDRPAKVLRAGFNFEIFAIGVSDSVDKDELKSIASEPFRTHVYQIKDYATLVKLKELITTKGTDYDECGVAGDTQLRDSSDKRFRIVGGREAKAGAWPWLAAIYVKGSFRCGGALIARDWVVTAAHCFYYDGKIVPSDILVRLGEHDRTLEEGSEQNVRASNLVLHPLANKNGLDFDVALIQLKGGVKLTAYVRTVCLPQPTDAILVRPGSVGIVAGWGSTQKGDASVRSGPPYPVLKQVQLPFVSHRVCQVNHTNAITKRMRCAGDVMGERDACKGDSGSPIVVKRTDGSWSAVGLSSWGEGCAQKGKFGVYADLLSAEYDLWITRTAGLVRPGS